MTVPTSKSYRIFPEHPVTNSLTGNVLVLLADLYWHCNAKTGQLNPRIETLAHNRGWSYSKAYAQMRVLRDCGIVRAIRGRRSSSYEIRPTEEWHQPVCRTVWPRRKPALSNSNGECPIADSTNLNPPIPIERETFFPERETAGDVVSGSSVVAPEEPTQAAAAAGGSSENISAQTQTPGPATSEVQALILELAPNHPQPGNVHRAAPVLEEILRKTKDRPATIAQIRSNHQAWRLYWNALPAGRFIAQLHRWFADGDWQFAPGPEAIAALNAPRKPMSKAERYEDLWEKVREISEDEKQRRTA